MRAAKDVHNSPETARHQLRAHVSRALLHRRCPPELLVAQRLARRSSEPAQVAPPRRGVMLVAVAPREGVKRRETLRKGSCQVLDGFRHGDGRRM